MAITRAQQAKQMLQNGGRIGLQGGGRDMGTKAGDTRAARDNREIGARMDRTRSLGQGDAMRRNQEAFRVGVDKGDYQRFKTETPRDVRAGFSSIFFNSPIGKDFRKFLRRKNIEYFEDTFDGPLTLSNYKKFYQDMRDRFKGKDDGLGDADYLQIPQLPLVQAPSDMDQEPSEDEKQLNKLRLAFRADGGRIGAQEGGIMPRLNQLGSGVSSAEQMLQEINQRLESAESSLGGGGAMQQPASLASDVFTSAGVTGGPQVSDLRTVTGGGMFDGKQFDSVKSAYDYAVKSAADQRAGGFMGRMVLPGEMGFEGFSGLFNRLNDPNAPQPQLASAPISGIPAAGISGIPAAGYADGGNVVGGEFDFESARQMYGLGKLVKKVTRTVKKIAKSPVGKLAIGAAVLGTPFGAGAKGTGFFGPKSLFGRGLGFIQGMNINKALLGTADYQGGPTSLFSNLFSKIPGGGITAAIAGTSLLAGLLTPEQEEEAEMLAAEKGIDIEAARKSILARAQGNIPGDFRATAFRAEGGPAEGKEPVAKKTMPLLDMGGQEMDLRAEGGFVPIGRMEKADDVPARLSKNEFVFTADAVRNAGDGDVDKGAEVMYNMMKNLEAGGEVSKESQGLEGARKMFQTSQRLEEVL